MKSGNRWQQPVTGKQPLKTSANQIILHRHSCGCDVFWRQEAVEGDSKCGAEHSGDYNLAGDGDDGKLVPMSFLLP